MSLTRPSEVRALLEALDLRPSKVLGQNFLIDGNILAILLDAAAVTKDDRVLEVGPGLGAVTEALLDRAGEVVAIEKDSRLAAHLVRRFGDRPGLTLLHRDATDVDLPGLLRDHRITKLVANLPYSVGSRILVDCFHAHHPLARLVVTVQKEVGDRLAARVGTADYGLLSIWAQLDHAVSLTKVVSPSCFYPPPKIRSAIVTLTRRPRAVAVADEALFNRLVKTAFAARRKQIRTVLNGMVGAAACEAALRITGIAPEQRPEAIPVEAWCRLANALG